MSDTSTPEPEEPKGSAKLPDGSPVVTVDDVEEGEFIDGDHTDSQI